jgi:hypothetical protein
MPVLNDGADSRPEYYADRPVTDPKNDAFGFVAYAEEFALLMNDPRTDTPLTVAISGPWGSGKTSLAELLCRRLADEKIWQLYWKDPPVTCWFNAWMHGDAPNVGAALAASVTRQVSRHRPWYWRLLSPLPSVMLSPERRAWRRVWVGLVLASSALLVLMGTLWLIPGVRPAGGALGHLFGHWQILTVYAAIPALIGVGRTVFRVSGTVGTFIDAPQSAAAQGTIAEVCDQLRRVMRQAQRQWRGQAQRRVVIFVDDLERCPADKALDMCEVVSQLLGQQDVVTVLIADLDLLESAAETRYRPSGSGTAGGDGYTDVGQEYLHKLIQLRFNLPPLDRNDVAALLGLTAAKVVPK